MKCHSTPPEHPPSFPGGRVLVGLLLSVASMLGTVVLNAALAETYTIVPEAKGNRIVFESRAPMESFEGETSHISGSISLDPTALGDSMTVEVSAELATLDTGIGLRNTHMRENHLHTDRYPRAVFRGATLIGQHPAQLVPGKAVVIEVEGSFSLHGVTRRLAVPVELTLHEDGGLEARTTFEVFLADYEIPRPKMLFMKLDEKQKVTLQIRAEAS